jgi:hypothetical protein
MVPWRAFEAAAPDLAAAGRSLLYQYGIGLGYLATVRRDGAPRVHPFCPIIASGSLWALVGPSPKQRDLLRDGRYAVHAFPARDRDDEFLVTGRARRVDDAVAEAAVRAAYAASGGGSDHSELLFELLIASALLATYKARGEPDNWPPRYTRWRAP